MVYEFLNPLKVQTSPPGLQSPVQQSDTPRPETNFQETRQEDQRRKTPRAAKRDLPETVPGPKSEKVLGSPWSQGF